MNSVVGKRLAAACREENKCICCDSETKEIVWCVQCNLPCCLNCSTGLNIRHETCPTITERDKIFLCDRGDGGYICEGCDEPIPNEGVQFCTPELPNFDLCENCYAFEHNCSIGCTTNLTK